MASRVPYGIPAAPAPAAAVTTGGDCAVRAIEVVQAIQDVANSVTLIADKKTIVRVYVDAPPGAPPGALTGELAWRCGRAGEAYLPARQAIVFDPADHPELEEQRLDLRKSLNFVLPAQAIAAGRLDLRVSRLFFLGGDQYRPVGESSARIEFETAPPLRLRVIGLRYGRAGTDETFAPDSIHFEYLRSYLLRAYPVARIEWSQQVLNARFTAPFTLPHENAFSNSAVAALAELMALRASEVGRAGGIDPRTHYYGLVSDRGAFLQGKSIFVPGLPRPDTVAVGPAGVPSGTFAHDLDQSYADWYGAHELGHTLGRAHPGFPPLKPPTLLSQGRDDPAFPYPEGRISDENPRFLGFDVGDPDLGLEMTVLSAADCHDIMTYQGRQWPSAYTYEAILHRLKEEDALVP
jgi:hypothetical protein